MISLIELDKMNDENVFYVQKHIEIIQSKVAIFRWRQGLDVKLIWALSQECGLVQKKKKKNFISKGLNWY